MFWRDLMILDLEEKIRAGKDGQSYTDYSLLLVRPEIDDPERARFEKKYLREPEDRFQFPEQEEAVISFYRDAPCRLPILNLKELPNVFRFGVDLYRYAGSGVFHNHNKSLGINYYLAKRIDLPYYQSLAVRNLLSAVQDEDLSLGDRMIIRNIALNAFHHALGLAMEPDRKYIFSFCFNRLNINEAALAELERYGFTVKSEKVVKMG